MCLLSCIFCLSCFFSFTLLVFLSCPVIFATCMNKGLGGLVGVAGFPCRAVGLFPLLASPYVGALKASTEREVRQGGGVPAERAADLVPDRTLTDVRVGGGLPCSPPAWSCLPSRLSACIQLWCSPCPSYPPLPWQAPASPGLVMPE